jgi:uncharacterized LabA/DUF88 family protein
MAKSIKKDIVYAFIDSQNLNLGTSKDILKNKKLIYKGWRLDFNKFLKFLKNKFKVSKAFLFIGYIKQNQKLYDALKSYGYILIFKPTVMDNHGVAKGNIDAEIVLHSSAIEYKNYNKAVIVSGDGDFYCLHEFLLKYDKLSSIIIPNQKSESSLLKKFHQYKIFLSFEKSKLEYKNGGRRK